MVGLASSSCKMGSILTRSAMGRLLFLLTAIKGKHAIIRGMKRIFFAVLLLLLPVNAGIHTIATITGANAAVAISTDSTARASWVQVIAGSSNSGSVMFGDSTVSSTQGLPIAAGGGYNTPACNTCVYTLNAVYVYVWTGDKAYVACGN